MDGCRPVYRAVYSCVVPDESYTSDHQTIGLGLYPDRRSHYYHVHWYLELRLENCQRKMQPGCLQLHGPKREDQIWNNASRRHSYLLQRPNRLVNNTDNAHYHQTVSTSTKTKNLDSKTLVNQRPGRENHGHVDRHRHCLHHLDPAHHSAAQHGLPEEGESFHGDLLRV